MASFINLARNYRLGWREEDGRWRISAGGNTLILSWTSEIGSLVGHIGKAEVQLGGKQLRLLPCHLEHSALLSTDDTTHIHETHTNTRTIFDNVNCTSTTCIASFPSWSAFFFFNLLTLLISFPPITHSLTSVFSLSLLYRLSAIFLMKYIMAHWKNDMLEEYGDAKVGWRRRRSCCKWLGRAGDPEGEKYDGVGWIDQDLRCKDGNWTEYDCSL